MSSKSAKYQQCTRCVMDTTDPAIYFNEEGHCNHCITLLTVIENPAYKAYFIPEGFKKLVQRMKAVGRRSPYDCVLGVSGGADSCYLAYLLKKEGLRVLLVHMDNGWNSEQSVRNINALVDVLKMDFETVVLDWNEFKDIQTAFLRASVVEAETPTDIAIMGALHQKASKHGVKYIVSASNLATEGVLPYDWHYNAKDSRYLIGIQRKFGNQPIRSLPTFGVLQEAWYKIVRRIRIVYPLNYLPYVKEEAIATLIKELNWYPYGGKHHESRYTKFIQSYLLVQKFGIDYRKATFSSQICFGTLTRTEALEKLSQPPFLEQEVEREKTFIAKKLSLSRQELDEILALPPKSFRDYPNNQKKLTILYRLYRKLTNSGWRSFPGTANEYAKN